MSWPEPAYGEGEPEIPTVEALAGWLPMAPETAQKEAGELLKQLPWPRMIIDGHLVKDGDLARTAWWDPTTAADGRQVLMCIAVFDWQPSDDDARFEYWDHCEHPVVLKVERVHELWRNADPQPRHPLAPLVRAWWKRPQHIEADMHPNAVLPAGTLQHAPSSATYRSLEDGVDRTREPEQFELAYPGGPGKVSPETVQLDLLPAEHATTFPNPTGNTCALPTSLKVLSLRYGYEPMRPSATRRWPMPRRSYGEY